MSQINVQVLEVPLVSADVPGFLVSGNRNAAFSVYTNYSTLVTLQVPEAIDGVLQGGLNFEQPATWGSVWGQGTTVPLQQSGIMTHLWVTNLGIAKILKVLDDSNLVIEDMTGAYAALGPLANCHVLDANYRPPVRMSLTSQSAWWLGGEGDVFSGLYGQSGGATYVIETQKPYAVISQDPIFVILEY